MRFELHSPACLNHALTVGVSSPLDAVDSGRAVVWTFSGRDELRIAIVVDGQSDAAHVAAAGPPLIGTLHVGDDGLLFGGFYEDLIEAESVDIPAGSYRCEVFQLDPIETSEKLDQALEEEFGPGRVLWVSRLQASTVAVCLLTLIAAPVLCLADLGGWQLGLGCVGVTAVLVALFVGVARLLGGTRMEHRRRQLQDDAGPDAVVVLTADAAASGPGLVIDSE